MNIIMNEEVNNNIAIIESFINYCKNNDPDINFLKNIANQIRSFYSHFSNDDDNEINNLYKDIESKYNFSDIEFIDNSDDSDNDYLTRIENDSPDVEKNKDYDNKDNIYRDISNNAQKRLDEFMSETFDSDKIHLYKKKSNVLKNLNKFVIQSDMY